MKKTTAIIFSVIFVFCFVGAGSWDDFSEEEDNSFIDNSNPDESDVTRNDENFEGDGKFADSTSNDEMGEGKFTLDFYLAVGVLTFILILIIYLVYSFFKRPVDKWEK